MLTFIWVSYLVVVLIMSGLVFLQKGEDSVSFSQSKFMTPRAMSNFLTKSTYIVIFIFITLCLLIGILLKKEKIRLNKELAPVETIVTDSNSADSK